MGWTQTELGTVSWLNHLNYYCFSCRCNSCLGMSSCCSWTHPGVNQILFFAPTPQRGQNTTRNSPPKKAKMKKNHPKLKVIWRVTHSKDQDQHRILGLINQKMNKIDQNSSQTSQIPTAKATLFLQFYKIFNKIPTFFGDQSCESFSRYKTTQAGFLERLRLAQDVLSQQQEECSIKVLVWEEKRWEFKEKPPHIQGFSRGEVSSIKLNPALEATLVPQILFFQHFSNFNFWPICGCCWKQQTASRLGSGDNSRKT